MLGAGRAEAQDLAKYGRLKEFAAAAGCAARPVTVAVKFDQDGRNPQGVSQNACVRCGDCVTGCNFGAKNTLPMNYLAEAKALGAELYVGATVSHVQKADGYWNVHWRRTAKQHPPERDPADPDRDCSHVVRASHVVLSAGTFGSTEILLRSRAQGLHVSGKLGKRFSTNGDMIGVLYNERGKVNAVAREHEEFKDRAVGPTITGMFSTGGPRESRVVVEELAVPGPLGRMFAEIVTTGALPVQLGRMDWGSHRRDDRDPAAVHDGHIERTQIYAAMGDDGAEGAMELVEGWAEGGPDGAIRIEWKDAGKKPIYAAQDELLRKSERLGGMYLRNPLWKPLPDSLSRMLSGKQPEGSLLTVHPLGGCPMGEDWKEGVVDDLGQVYDPSEPADLARVHAGLLVLDGSIVPVALGINPLLTITALAERAAQRYIAQQGWHARLGQARFEKAFPPLPPRAPAPEANTMVRFSERMRGPLRLAAGAEEHETALEVTFDDIGGGPGGLLQFLRDGPHEVNIGKGSLVVNLKPAREEEAALAARRAREQDDAARRRRILEAGEALGREETDRRLEALWQEIRDRDAAEERARLERRKSQPEQVAVPVEGTVWWMERASSCAGTRTLRALWAYVRNRGIADVIQDARRGGGASLAAKVRQIPEFFRLASNVGETRYLRYELRLREDLAAGGARLPKGTVVKGLKTFRYAYAENPWQQLSRLKVSIEPPGGGAIDAGTLEIDLKHLVQRFTAMFQITRQADQPTGMLDVASIALFMLRIVAKIHFWSFRAPEYEKYDGERAKRRLPGELKGLKRRVFPAWVERKGKEGEPKAPLALQLTRYWKNENEGKPAGDPVMLIHGFGSGGVQFAHPALEENAMARFLGEAGYDVWAAELRTSIALPYSRNQWTLDEVAKEDIPALVDEVLRQTGRASVDIVAHCIGSAMFCTAVLGVKNEAGAVPFHDKIRSAALLQVGPLITLSPGNRFRGYVAAAMRRFMLTDHVDSSIDDRATALDTILDRLLWTYPYPQKEQRHHALCPPWRAHTHIANCNRSAAVFSRLVEHDKVVPPGRHGRSALDLLGDMIGHTNLTTFEQTGQYAFARRLTDRDASNMYVTDENVLARFGFPVRFLHGENNDVFNVDTSRRSLRLLQDLFRGRHTSDAVILPGYGHLDPLIGHSASKEVFPHIVEFLRHDANRGKARLQGDLELRQNYPRPPLIGPVLGWTRRENGKRYARIWCRTDDEASYAYFLIAVVLGGGAQPPAYLQPLHDSMGRRLGEIDLLGVVDVPLPDEDRDYEIVLVGAHRSSDENMSDPAELRTHPLLTIKQAQEIDTTIRATLKEQLKATAATPLPPGYAAAVLQERGERQDALAAAAGARRVDDPGYFGRIDSVFLPKALLARLDRQPSIEFALACCRYSASLIDRERADASFGVLRGLLEPRDGAAARPLSLLLLVGDQIYADATAGMFDPKNRRGRFDDSYREAWTAPNARAVLRRLPTYMMMDDHEVADDWHPWDREERMVKGMPDCRTWGLIAFEDYQLAHSPWVRAKDPEPAPERTHGMKYWYRFESGGFHFFVCDTRSRRQGRERIISRRQMQELQAWMLERQRADDGRPMFVVSPAVVLPESRTRESDDWSGFTYSLNELFSFIAAHGIRNVVFLCGDSHLDMATEIAVTGGPRASKCLCVLAAPLYAPMPFANGSPQDAYDARSIGLGGGRRVDYARRTVGGGDGVAVIGAQQGAAGRWSISVEIHRAGGQARRDTYELD
jgi:choline dehydrogenase-like flavoprotein